MELLHIYPSLLNVSLTSEVRTQIVWLLEGVKLTEYSQFNTTQIFLS